MNNYEWLIARLDAFIRKYYINQVIRGALVFLICILFYILTVSIGEYYLYMPVAARVAIVSLFVILAVSSLIIWIIIPLTKMARMGKMLSHEQAAEIIGRHFPEISDKLLNILQLKKSADDHASRELIAASIDQKASQISVIPINNAIDLSKNRKYLPYLLPLVLIGVFILVAAPNVFRDASRRLLQPTKTFEKPAPFSFIIKNTSLQAIRNSDFTLTVVVKGNALPAEMSIVLNNEKVQMLAMDGHQFQYTFRNITDPVTFNLFAAGYYSQPYTLNVVQKPVLKAFKIQINYPTYTGKKDEVRNSLGDMTLPVGTKVSWAFIAEHTDNVSIHLGNGVSIPLSGNAGMYGYQYRFMNDTSYTFSLRNKRMAIADSYRYQVQVIPDQYPVIQLQHYADSVTGKQILLNGTAGDDYGITRVSFNYEVVDDKNHPLSHNSVPLKITPGALTTFQHYFDIGIIPLQPGQKLNYYIEAWDNDGVHGPKSSRSEVMTFQMYDAKQVDSAINANAQQINSGISNSAEKTEQLQDEFKDMQSKMLESNEMDWQQQQSLQQMQKQQQQLQNQIENIKKRFEEQKQQSEQKKYSDDLKDKQDALQKQLDNMLNNELKEQMKKLEDLMKKLNKDQAFQTMQQMQQENKLFDMDLQRIQELMKKLEEQMRMEDMANKMDDLAKKQLDLKAQTDQAKKDNAALSQDQKQLKNDLDKAMQQDMKELQKGSDKQDNKDGKQGQQDAGQQLQEEQQKGKDAQKDMQQSQQELDKNDKDKSSKEQQDAAKNLQEMAKMLREKADGMDMKEIDMDIRATRQILTNLIRLSFDQEDLMGQVKTTSTSSQKYLDDQKEQNRLHSNSYMIRDSLFSLSKRIFQISATVNKETTGMEHNMKAAVDALENRNTTDAVTRQQYVMTHANNLALMLNEILSNLMQMQMKGKGEGQGSSGSPSPGGKKPSKGAGQQLADIITEQQQLGNSMQQGMGKGGQQGKKPGERGKGQQGNNGQGQGQSQGGQGSGGSGQGEEGPNQGEYGDAEQLARFAEQQASIRRQLQELTSLLNSKGMGNAKDLQEIQQKMDKNETDIVNRRLTPELLERQKEIQTRLLEAEKSLREQEQDDKRTSRSGQDLPRPMPPELQKYMTDRQQLLELYKTVPPQLKPYYRQMVEHYYQMIGK